MKKRFISLLLSLSMLVSIIPTALADEIEPDNSVQNNENRVEPTETVPAPVETLLPNEANEVSKTTSEPIETASPSVEAETPEATHTESVTASDDDSIETDTDKLGYLSNNLLFEAVVTTSLISSGIVCV